MNYLKNKSDIFTADEIKKVLTEMYDNIKPTYLGENIAVTILYYGLLYRDESFTIQIKDVKLNLTKDVNIYFPYSTKWSEKDLATRHLHG